MNIDRVIRKIRVADCAAVDAILNAALNRKTQLCPEWEIMYFAFFRDQKEKWKKTVAAVLKLLAVQEGDE